VGSFTSTDPDAGDIHTYSLVSGVGDTDNLAFSVSSNKLLTNTTYNVNTKSSYSIRVQSNDGFGGVFQKGFTVTITNSNDAPTDIQISNDSIFESMPPNTLVGSFSTSDPDIGDTHTYSFLPGTNDNASFAIVGNQLRSVISFNYELKSSYFILVETNDGKGGNFSMQFNISVKDTTDGPTDISVNNIFIAENMPASSFVGVFTSTDEDATDSFTYSLVSGTNSTDNADFQIVNDTLFTVSVFDFESRTAYNIRVRSTDASNLYTEKSFAINVIDANDSPTDIAVSNAIVGEDVALNTTVGVLTTIDPDTGNTHSYSIVAGIGGTDNDDFKIVGNAVKTDTVFNFNTKSVYSIRVKSTDGLGAFFEKVIAINITDANDAPADIVISNDSIFENLIANTIVGSLSTIDPDVSDSHSYSFVSGGADNGSFVIIGNQLRSIQQFNFETKNSYFISIQTNDNKGGSYTKQFNISIKNANDAPTDISISDTTILENMPIGTFIAALGSTDEDLIDIYSYSLIAGTNSTNNTSFLIRNDSLFSAIIFNFESKTHCSIRVRTTDQSNTFTEKGFNIQILDGNDTPTSINLSNATIAENTARNTTVGLFTSIDADASDSYTYSLVSGNGSTDNSSFLIIGNELKTDTSFNVNIQSSFSLQVRTTDSGGLTADKQFSITIVNSNDAPTDILISNDSLFENVGANTTIGALSAVDDDAADIHSYSLVQGAADNNLFAILGNELRSAQLFNFEVKNSYFISIQTDDNNGGTFTKQINISIKDANDAPTNILVSDTVVQENMTVSTFVGTFSSIDEDAVDNYNYSLVSGIKSTDNSSFQISNDSLFSASVFNFETKSLYSIRVRTTDNSSSFLEKAFKIQITDGNDMPSDITLSNLLIGENSPRNTTVAAFSSIDADVSDSYTYSLVMGIGSIDNGSFTVSGNELKTDTTFDVNVKNNFSIRVKSTDFGGLFTEKQFNLTITNTNDAPTDIQISNDSIFENLSVNALVGTFTTPDADAGDSHSYSLAGGSNDNSSFTINGNELRTTQVFDYETKKNYFITVQTSDGNGGIFLKQMVVFVKDTADTPINILLNNNLVAENKASGTFIGMLSTIDADANDSFSYTLVSGSNSTDNSSFQILNDSLFTNSIFDFELRVNYSIRIRTTDAYNLSFEQVFGINITDGNDFPTNINISNLLIPENTIRNTTIAQFTSVDTDQSDSYTYSLVSGSGSIDNRSFYISAGELKTDTTFDLNLKPTYSIRVRTTDLGGLSFEKQFTITITNSNDAPTDIQISNDSIFENSSANSLIGNFSTTDPDVGDIHTYSLTGGLNDNLFFTIIGNQLRSTQQFDFETKNNYFISVQTTDVDGSTFAKQFTILVKDAGDAPLSIILNNTSIAENQFPGAFIGLFSTNDADIADDFSYSLVSGSNSSDNGSFQISNDSLFTNGTFNYELRKNYSIRVRSTDLSNLSVEQFFGIVITNANDTPIGINLDNRVIGENAAINSLVGNLTTVDPDTIDAHTYALVAGSGDTDNDDFTIIGNSIRVDTVFDVNIKNSYSIRAQATDGFGATFQKVFTISITNVNDAPTDIALAPDNINENLPANTSVGNFSTVDEDFNDRFTYTFANLSSNDNASFVIVGNELRTSSSFDYETKAVYFIQVLSTDAGGLSYSRQLFINVNDTNDTPTDMILSANSIAEKQPVGEFLGRVNSVDQDAVDTYTYSLVNGTGADDNTGFVTSNDSIFSNTSFDVLVKSQLSIRVRTTDSKNQFFEKVFLIFVQDVNDAPTDISIDNASAPENTAINSIIGNFTTADIDPMQTFTYQLAAGTGDSDNGNFIITGSQLKSSVLLDYNTKRTHNIRIKSTDQGGLLIEKAFTINVTNSNDAPTDISLTPNNFNENLPQSTLIGLLSTADKDSSDTFNYSFVNQGANDNAAFIISGSELRTAQLFDYENKNLYIVLVQTTDYAGLTFNRQIAISVTDSNDAPTALLISADSLLEKQVKGTFVADLSTTDEDITDSFTYSLVAGQGANDNALFRINGSFLETDSTLNFFNGAIRNVRIQSTDKGGRVISNAFVIQLINQNDLPTNILLSDTSINEIAAIGARVATLSSEDEDVGDTFIYELVSGIGDAGNSNFLVDGNELKTKSDFDFEALKFYSIRIRTTDNHGGSFEKAITIAITNGNEKPTIDDQLFSINENTAPNIVVGTIGATDVDAMETFSYKVLENQFDFQVDAFSGELISLRILDYENQTSYIITVEVTDAGGLKDTANVTIQVLDQIEGSLPAAGYFSPNGDGINDTWSVKNVELYTDYKLTLFSVNGQIVYEKISNYNNDWDGTINGSELPEGIYYYLFLNNQSSNKNFKGIITLKR
jgi:gliding motility-associated-like protein